MLAAAVLFVATRPSSPPGHVAWKGVTAHRGGNTTLGWSLVQRHSDLAHGTTVLAHLRVQCVGHAVVRPWGVRAPCPLDAVGIAVHPTAFVFESETPQTLRAELDMVELHRVPPLQTWTPL
jgi:hypothetical protein